MTAAATRTQSSCHRPEPTDTEHRLSRHVFDHELDDGRYAVWNAYWPHLAILTAGGRAALETLPRNQERWPPEMLKMLVEHRILYTGEDDPYEAEFFATADRWVEKIDEEAEAFHRDGAVYHSLSLVNSGCNLGCNYCVSYYGDDAREADKRDAARGKARHVAVINVVDQFVEGVQRGGNAQCEIAFNGGEILLRWDTVKAVLEHVRGKYPEIEPTWVMNTNATLLTREIADLLAEYGVRVAVSIDGYQELHDASRVYHDGAASFEQVMAGIQNYRTATGKFMPTFQGTIDNIEDFDFDKFFAMERHGFKAARLAPNLLDQPDPQRGRDGAFWEASLAIASEDREMILHGTQFENRMKQATTKPGGFRPNCGGLSGTKLRALVVNIDSMQASQLCSFSSPAAISMESAEHRIDHRALWDASRQYILDRLDMLKNDCRGCSVIGVCQGGCVYTALDVYNRKNPAGCAYQRALWRHAIEYHEDGRVRRLRSSPEDVKSQSSPRLARNATPTPAVGPVALMSSDGRTVWPAQPVA